MRKFGLFAAALCALWLSAARAEQVVSEPANASINSAIGICSGVPATRAVIGVIGVSAYVTYNGSTPSSSNGFQYSAGQFVSVNGALITQFQIIGASAGGSIHVMCLN